MGRYNGGRGPGRNGHRSGRGHGRNNRQNNNNGRNKNWNKSTQRELKFAPQVPGSQRYATFATVKEAFIHECQKELTGGLDVAKSLKDKALIDLDAVEPTRKLSTKPDVNAKKIEQDGFDILYQEELRRHGDRTDELNKGMSQCYSLLITKYCTKKMKSRLEEHPDYDSKLKDDAIETLEAIQTLVKAPVRAQYPYVTFTDDLIGFLTSTNQDHGDSLHDYTKVYKQEVDVIKACVPDTLLNKFLESTKGYQDAGSNKKKKMKDEALDRWIAYVYLKNSDQDKYGSVLKGLQSQFSLENDQYPADLAAAIDVLSNHPFDKAYYDKQKQRKEQAQKRAREREHEQTNEDENVGNSFAQKGDIVCYCCGKDHLSTTCSKAPKTPKKDWWINRVIQQHHQQEEYDQSSDEDTSDDESVQSSTSSRSSRSSKRSSNRRSGSKSKNKNLSWSSFQHHAFSGFQKEGLVNKQSTKKSGSKRYSHLKDMIILDTGSTIKATLMNPDFVHDVRVSKRPMNMGTNAGNKRMNLEATVPDMGPGCYFDPEWVANIFGFSHMADVNRITYDNWEEDAFLVHTKDGIIKFKRTKDGLYAYTPSEEYIQAVAELKHMEPPPRAKKMAPPPQVFDKDGDVIPKLYDEESGTCNMVCTVAENRKNYTQRQFDDAKKARRLYHIVGCPALESFKQAIRQRIIKNNPVTVADVNIAERIFGPDLGTLKGKSTRSKPPRVKDDWVEIPPELLEQHHDITFCMDIMYVNGLPMFTGIDKSVKHRGLVPLKNREADELYKALDEIFRYYNDAGFLITDVHCDREFKPLMDVVKDELDVNMNYTARGEHVPEAERNNRTIGERIRATFHNLPFKAIPKIMIKFLSMVCADNLNIFPTKGGISSYFSPKMIMSKKDYDYLKHCQAPFGAYVHGDLDTTNTNAPRTVDAIYFRPINNKQGGHELMNLNTGELITCKKIHGPLPMTDLVINAVEQMAYREGFKTLKITGKNNVPLFPADWTAGVDYDESITEDADDPEYQPRPRERVHPRDLDLDDEYDNIDQDEIDELINDDVSNGPEINNIPEDETGSIQSEESESEDEDEQEQQEDASPTTMNDEHNEQRRTSRTPKPRMLLNPTHGSKSYGSTETKNVHFMGKDEKLQMLEMLHNITTDDIDPEDTIEYDPQLGMVIAQYIADTNDKMCAQEKCFAQQYIYQKGLKVFGKEQGEAAGTKELDQLHHRECFTPVDLSEMTAEEKSKAQEALMFLTEKRDKSIKGRMVYNGKPTRDWMTKEDTASPTVSLESIFLTAVVDAKEGRDVMTADVPNAFIQTPMPDVKPGEPRVIMKITGVLVNLLVKIQPEIYGPYVVYENNRKILYVRVLKALYGSLVASLLWYKQFRSDLEDKGYKFNPYDPCVANKKVNGKQHTVRFHVDDLMASHMDSKVNDKFLKWLNKMYGTYGEVKATRGPIHDYLGMTFDFSDPGKVKIDMIDYMNAMVDDFSMDFKEGDVTPNPAGDDLFAEGTGNKLDKQQAQEYHTFVAKGLFASKRARPDIQPTIAVLCTRVKEPNEDDWRKLIKLLKYINNSKNDKLILSADDLHVIKWHVDAAFAVHPDFKSHTGGTMTYGQGAVQSMSRKQKLNTKSSTTAELVGTDDLSTMILWTKLFMEAQGYKIKKNILYQDNKSTILLLNNGKRSSSKRTRAINIRYFFLTDQIEKGNMTVEYCPTGDMTADFMSKPVQGKLFQKFKKEIMGH